jgi:hypothetical protein
MEATVTLENGTETQAEMTIASNYKGERKGKDVKRAYKARLAGSKRTKNLDTGSSTTTNVH